MEKALPVVSSWNEWDPLEEIVVGSADHAAFEPTEPGCRPQQRGRYGAEGPPPFPKGPKSREVIENANQELAGLTKLLESLGVTVRRPEPFDFTQPVRTPNFSVENQYCAVCPRDAL